jgi:excisionase family DNA binding protein
MTKERKEKLAGTPTSNNDSNSRLNHAIGVSETARLARMGEVKAKTGRTDLPPDSRKLTQQEAAAYCGVSPTTIHRWVESGLKTVQYGARKRFLISDLKAHMKKCNSLKLQVKN